MGRRSEQRIAISFPVIARGTDSRGTRFLSPRRPTTSVFPGAALNGLNAIMEPGSKIEVEFGDQKAWFKVQWVGTSGSQGRTRRRSLPGAGQVHLGRSPKGGGARHLRSAKPVSRHRRNPVNRRQRTRRRFLRKATDRRQFARHTCRIEAQILPRTDSAEIRGTITDISLGGCYVEMLSPLPSGDHDSDCHSSRGRRH